MSARSPPDATTERLIKSDMQLIINKAFHSDIWKRNAKANHDLRTWVIFLKQGE